MTGNDRPPPPGCPAVLAAENSTLMPKLTLTLCHTENMEREALHDIANCLQGQ